MHFAFLLCLKNYNQIQRDFTCLARALRLQRGHRHRDRLLLGVVGAQPYRTTYLVSDYFSCSNIPLHITLLHPPYTHTPRRIEATMVRVKNRYLVVNFLYPEPHTKTKSKLPDVIQIHSPTPDALKPGFIVRMIRDGVEELFGDYGSGMVSSGLKGKLQFPLCLPYTYTRTFTYAVAYSTVTNTRPHSKLLLPLN